MKALCDSIFELSATIRSLPKKRQHKAMLQAGEITKDFRQKYSAMRVVIEWILGHVQGSFPFPFEKDANVMGTSDIVGNLKFAVILQNFLVCLNGSQASKYFGTEPPTLEQYLNEELV